MWDLCPVLCHIIWHCMLLHVPVGQRTTLLWHKLTSQILCPISTTSSYVFYCIWFVGVACWGERGDMVYHRQHTSQRPTKKKKTTTTKKKKPLRVLLQVTHGTHKVWTVCRSPFQFKSFCCDRRNGLWFCMKLNRVYLSVVIFLLLSTPYTTWGVTERKRRLSSARRNAWAGGMLYRDSVSLTPLIQVFRGASSCFAATESRVICKLMMVHELGEF